MSDIRKLIDILNETTAGAVASVAQPIGATQKRVEEDGPKMPEIIEYGNWENSALTTSSKLKKDRQKSAKVVKSIYGEEVVAEVKSKIKESKTITEMDKSETPPGRDGGHQFPPGPKVSKKVIQAVKKDPAKHLADLFDKEYAKKKIKKEQGVAEGSDVTDYNPKSQGGTRKELLAKYHKTKDPKDAEAARRAGATQKELQGVAEGDKLQGTPVVSLSDFDDKDNKKNKYGQTVPKKLEKDDPRVKFHKEPKKQGVAEGLIGDVVVHNYTKMPIDLKPGQAQIHGWGPNDQPIYRVKGADGKEVITSNKKKMIMVAQGQGVAEGMDPEKRSRLDDLIDQYRDSTDPNDYYDRDYSDPEDVIAMIRAEFGDRIADKVEAGADKMHFSRPGHTSWKADPLGWKKPIDRTTKAGKMYKQDSDFRKNTIKSRYNLSGKSATEGVAEGYDDEDEGNPVMNAIINRIMRTRPDLLKHDLQKLQAAIRDVAAFVGDVDEIGTSDVSGWVKQVEQHLSTEMTDEGVVDTLKKVGKKVIDVIAPDDEALIKDLKKKVGMPAHGQKRMAVPHDEDQIVGKLEEQDLIIHPASMGKNTVGLMSKPTHPDHEIEMAKSDLYQASKNALAIFNLIKDKSETEGLEGWVQEKITKAEDYLNTVRQYLEGKQLESISGVGPSTKMFTSESDMEEGKTGPGLWANIHAKRKRIKAGSGERMRKPGSKGAPKASDFRAARSDKK